MNATKIPFKPDEEYSYDEIHLLGRSCLLEWFVGKEATKCLSKQKKC